MVTVCLDVLDVTVRLTVDGAGLACPLSLQTAAPRDVAVVMQLRLSQINFVPPVPHRSSRHRHRLQLMRVLSGQGWRELLDVFLRDSLLPPEILLHLLLLTGQHRLVVLHGGPPVVLAQACLRLDT